MIEIKDLYKYYGEKRAIGPVNATIHKVNECVATADLDRLSATYEDILSRLLRS